MLSQKIYEVEASPVEGQSLLQEYWKRRKRKGKKKKLSKFHFCVCPRKIVLVGEEGMPSCCECYLE